MVKPSRVTAYASRVNNLRNSTHFALLITLITSVSTMTWWCKCASISSFIKLFTNLYRVKKRNGKISIRYRNGSSRCKWNLWSHWEFIHWCQNYMIDMCEMSRHVNFLYFGPKVWTCMHSGSSTRSIFYSWWTGAYFDWNEYILYDWICSTWNSLGAVVFQ